jgi:hypothetical protein
VTVAFITANSLNNLFQPGPRPSCSADSPALGGFGAAGRPVELLACLRSGCPRFTSAALASFHFKQSR